MKRTLLAAIAIAALAGSAFAEDTAPAPVAAPAPEAAPAPAPAAAVTADPGVYQVLRTGDRDMSCEALGAEANNLNAKLMADQEAAAKKAKGGRFGRQIAGNATGGAMKIGGRMMLGRVIGSMSPMAGLVAVAANDAIGDSTAQAIANSGQGAAEPKMTPEQQRMNHLLGLYREKGC